MARKNRSHAPQGVPPVAPRPVSSAFLSPLGLKCVFSGAVSVAVGFIVLTFTDPAGQNAASRISPFLIVIGYVLIGFGLSQIPSES